MEGRQELEASCGPEAYQAGYHGVLARSISKHFASGGCFCGSLRIVPASPWAPEMSYRDVLSRAAALSLLLSSVLSQAEGRWLHLPLHVLSVVCAIPVKQALLGRVR